MKKIVILPGCISCGMCEQVSPDVFEVVDRAQVKEGISVGAYEKEILQAIELCPAQVITLKESDETTD